MAILVNGELIGDAAIREEERVVRRLLAEKRPGDGVAANEARAREWARENLIEQVLLRQATHREPELIAKLTSHTAKPRHKEVVEYYRKHREEFDSPEAAHVRHIVKNVDETTSEAAARAAIEEIQTALQQGASFEQLADEKSDCPGNGGDLGWILRDQMVAEFEAVAFGTNVGEVSSIFRSPFGFHILKVDARRAPGILPLEAVYRGIEDQLFARKKQKAVEQFIDNLRAKAVIQETRETPNPE